MRRSSASAASIFIMAILGFLLSGISADSTQKQKNPESGIPRQYGRPMELCLLKDGRINESSGIAASIRNKDAFWTNNDSGDSARIFLFNKNGETIAIVDIKGASAVDWEDIASFRSGDDSYVLIADAGDNDRRRQNYVLYIIAEPVIGIQSKFKELLSIEAEPALTISYRYEDGPHDCEAIAVDPTESTVYFVSKEPAECKVYSMPIPSKGSTGPNVAKAIAALKVSNATAMDISPDGMHAVVLTYGDGYEFVRLYGETWARAFSREPRAIKMPDREQGESICYGPDGKTLYLTSENAFQPLWEIPVLEGDGR
jgi:hypothetical protein